MIIGMKMQTIGDVETVMTLQAIQRHDAWVLVGRLDERNVDGTRKNIHDWSEFDMSSDSLLGVTFQALSIEPSAHSLAIHPVWEQAETYNTELSNLWDQEARYVQIAAYVNRHVAKRNPDRAKRMLDRAKRLKNRCESRRNELVITAKRGIFGLSNPTTSGENEDENARWT